jgi:alkanesulfonate monooxygenase SsuD/methylene tetrahydromethanopterin reductase-like flavin-dependent oxidoreductase (luciferase family)
LDDHLAAVKAAWGPDPVSYSGRFYSIPESYLGPKPVRLGGPPVLLGTQSVPGIRRAARWADGILPVTSVGSRLEDLESALRFFREATNDEGRPQLDVRLRAHTRITQEPLTGDRVPCSGSIDQVRDDLLRLEKLGVSEVCLNQTQIGVPFEQQLADAVAVKQSLT